jgi:putative OPT family oligopeptide transporter
LKAKSTTTTGPAPFKPYVAAETSSAELTVRAVVLGTILGIVFAAANAYLGLRVGLTVSASIPAAVMSMAILRTVLKRGTILENNMVQTIASSGEALAAGIIFTIPAFFIWNTQRGDVDIPGLGKIAYICILGGALGIVMMIPLRRLLIRDEHHTLPYPEGTACAEVLISGERGGMQAKKVINGVLIGALYKFGAGLGLWLETMTLPFRTPAKAYLGIEALPALAGVGYILGIRICAVMLAGGLMGALVLVPIIGFFGAAATAPIFPSVSGIIPDMTGEAIRGTYIRYIGAGAVTMGGILSLLKALPAILKTLRLKGDHGRDKNVAPLRTDHDLPNWLVWGGAVVVGLLTWTLVPAHPIVVPLIVVFGFIFVTVASRLVGLVGSSSNPVSGMTIATLLGTTILFTSFGLVGAEGMVAALLVGSVVCVAVCSAGDISQDLKTGYLVGATPWKQQVGEFVGLICGASVVGAVVHMLGTTYGFVASEAHPNPLQAPQANLMAILIEGVMSGQLPWDLIFIGMFTALVAELFGVSSLAFAVGLYLPVGLSVGVMVGGLLAWITKRNSEVSESEDPGILYSSGLIAGEALVGIGLAVLAYFEIHTEGLGEALGGAKLPLTLVVYGLLIYTIWRAARKVARA